jgi:hypothetical protein
MISKKGNLLLLLTIQSETALTTGAATELLCGFVLTHTAICRGLIIEVKIALIIIFPSIIILVIFIITSLVCIFLLCITSLPILVAIQVHVFKRFIHTEATLNSTGVDLI